METPKQFIFDEMKAAAISIWSSCGYTYGYVDEKLKTINSFDNYKDNAMVFYRMFDYSNQIKMRSKVSQASIDYINKNP